MLSIDYRVTKMRKSKDQEKQQLSLFVKNINAELGKNNITKRDLAVKTGINYQTLLRRFERPEQITFGEMQAMARYLNVSLTSLIG